jgi:hypothetical protein
MTITSSGNVGIGTTGPGESLDVLGTIQAFAPTYAPSIQFNRKDNFSTNRIVGNLNSYANTSGGSSAYLSTIAFGQSADYNGYITFNTNNGVALGERVRIDYQGNVGIGTTTPAYKLDVVGQINSSGGLCISGDCKTSWSQVGGSSQWTTSGSGIYYTGNVSIGTNAISYPLFVSTSSDNLFAIQRTGATYPTIFKQGTDGALVINNNNSDIVAIKSGNVGIGTTVPGSYKLSISGPSVNTGASGLMLTTPGGAQGERSAITLYSTFQGTSDNIPRRTADIIAGYNGGAWGNEYLSFNIGNNGSANDSAVVTSEKMRIQSNGNVGIGTTAPNARLHVVQPGGNVNPSLTYGAASAYILNTASADLAMGVLTTSPWSYWLQVRSSNNMALPISLNPLGGNVGIGTTGPQAKLDVQGGDIRTSGELYWNNGKGILSTDQTASIELGDSTAFGTVPYIDFHYGVGSSQDYNVRIQNDANGRLKLDAATLYITGNVGIGTTAPAYKLDVASGGGTTARFGTASSDTVYIGGGSGKLNVGTIDPIYIIGGTKYATYVPAMTGQKEETAGLIKIQNKDCYFENNSKVCKYDIDFKNQTEASDLWLFKKITDLKNNFDKMVVILNSDFKGSVWYKKQNDLVLTIYFEPKEEKENYEISYRFTAPRFDAEKWGNKLSEKEANESGGFIIND